jgi:hypothetical protein
MTLAISRKMATATLGNGLSCWLLTKTMTVADRRRGHGAVVRAGFGALSSAARSRSFADVRMFVRIVRLTIYSCSCMMHTVFTAAKAPFKEKEPKMRVSALIRSALVEKSVCAGTLRGYCHISEAQRIAAPIGSAGAQGHIPYWQQTQNTPP